MSAARNAAVVAKVAAVCGRAGGRATSAPDARRVRPRDRAGRRRPGRRSSWSISCVQSPFQERLLEQLAVARRRGHRNLLVSATGTGKTVMAALDHPPAAGAARPACSSPTARRSSTRAWPRSATPCGEPAFGERWVGGHRPTQFDHVFASIQSLTAAGLDDLIADHFDVVIVDEFHHAAAPSYASLDHVAPLELLGLTATPSTDGLSLLHRFDGRIAAELRLWDAIDSSTASPRSPTTASTTASTCARCRGGGGGATTSRGLTNLCTASDATGPPGREGGRRAGRRRGDHAGSAS